MKERKRLGLALCGSYCTYEKVLKEAEKLAADWDITAVMSETAACTDSRFGKAEDFIARLEELTGKPVMRTITAAGARGPGAALRRATHSALHGATLARLATGLTDTAVTMAAKSHLAQRPAGRRRVFHKRRPLGLGGEHSRAAQPEELLLRPLRPGRPAGETQLAAGGFLPHGRGRRRRTGGPPAPAGAEIKLHNRQGAFRPPVFLYGFNNKNSLRIFSIVYKGCIMV